MLDMFLVLGLVPGTSIQLNFFEIILLPLLITYLYHRHNYQKVYSHLERAGKATLTSGTFRTFVIWAALTIDKPRDSQFAQRYLGR